VSCSTGLRSPQRSHLSVHLRPSNLDPLGNRFKRTSRDGEVVQGGSAPPLVPRGPPCLAPTRYEATRGASTRTLVRGVAWGDGAESTAGRAHVDSTTDQIEHQVDKLDRELGRHLIGDRYHQVAQLLRRRR